MKWERPNRKACVSKILLDLNSICFRIDFGNTCMTMNAQNQTCVHTHVTLKIVFCFSHSFVAFNDDDDDDAAAATAGGGAIAFSVLLLHTFSLYIPVLSVLLFNI